VTGDARGAAETSHNPPGHLLEKRRATLCLAVQQTSESIQIMASDDGSFRRQLMNQLRVAVVYDMEEIKLRATAAQEARVIPEAIEQPICFEQFTATCPRQRKAATQQRSYRRHRDRFPVLALQIIEQHVRNQLHAR